LWREREEEGWVKEGWGVMGKEGGIVGNGLGVRKVEGK
jgi:hypothetical protein